MPARIRSLVNGILPVDDASRDDLSVGDIITVSAISAASTYAWTIVFAPESVGGIPSAATFSGSSGDVSPGSFTVDNPGAYLIRLVTDAGMASEDTQYVRLRALTSQGLRLVSAGERRDSTGIIPIDVSVEGWANEQNFNLQTLENIALAGERFIEMVVNQGDLAASPDTFTPVDATIPDGARVSGITIIVDTVWDGATLTFQLGDGTAPDRYAAAGDSNAGAAASFIIDHWDRNVSGAPITPTLTVTYTSGGTTGAVTVLVRYVEDPAS